MSIDDDVFLSAPTDSISWSSSCPFPRIRLWSSMIFYEQHKGVSAVTVSGGLSGVELTNRLHEVLFGRASLLLILKALDKQRYLLAQHDDLVFTLIFFVV